MKKGKVKSDFIFCGFILLFLIDFFELCNKILQINSFSCIFNYFSGGHCFLNGQFERKTMFLPKILISRWVWPPKKQYRRAPQARGRPDLVIRSDFLANYVEDFVVAGHTLPVAGDVVADYAVEPVTIVIHGAVIVKAALF